jgi:hypothetical protein
MTLADAKRMVAAGVKFGDVYPFLDDIDRDGQALKDYFCFCFEANPVHLNGKTAPRQETSGELCPKCGGFMVRTGTCLTCQSCGESSGGCG